MLFGSTQVIQQARRSEKWTHGVLERGADRLDDGDDVGAVGEAGEPQEALELLEPDDDGRSGHEPDDGRVRQEVHQETQPAAKTESMPYVLVARPLRTS